MNLKMAVMLAFLLPPLIGCGPRTIKKLPVPREHEVQAIRLVAEGDQLLQEGKEHLAMLKYLEASDLNPYHELTFNKLAITYVRLQMYYQARQSVNRAIGLKRDYAYAHNTKGIIDLADRDLRSAERSFARAIRLEPGVPSFYLNYGYTLIQSNRSEEAMAAYRKALDLDPGVLEGGRFLELNYTVEGELPPEKYYEMARVFAELGNLELALRYLGRAFSLGFNDEKRLRGEPAFRRFAEIDEFRRFLEIHGVSL